MTRQQRKRRLWYSLGTGGAILWCLLGAAGGMGTYTFYYAEGGSYLSDDASACANCHAMQGHYDAWNKSTHKAVATCNDCHAPHDSTVNKLYCKTRNGFFHSLAFTTGDYPDQLMITDYNRKVTEDACRYCHSSMVHAIDITPRDNEDQRMSCIRCHNEVGHSR